MKLPKISVERGDDGAILLTQQIGAYEDRQAMYLDPEDLWAFIIRLLAAYVRK